MGLFHPEKDLSLGIRSSFDPKYSISLIDFELSSFFSNLQYTL